MVDPQKAWALFISDPVDFTAMYVIVAGAVFGFAWWLRSFIGNERVAALEERIASREHHLKFAREKYDNSQAEVQKLTVYTRQLESDVDGLVAAMKSASTPVFPQLTAVRVTSDLMTGTVTSLSTANNALGAALTTDPSPQIGLWSPQIGLWKGNR
jgi:hypothetical protein